MEFNSSPEDKVKQAEFHTPEYVQTQLKVKNLMQVDLINAIDELSEVISSNAERIERLKGTLPDCKTEPERQQCQKGIIRYENLSDLANKVSEAYLMFLDVYTYGIYSLLTENEWDWRAFARHFYTILYEHPKTVNTQLNDIIRILKSDIDGGYDLTRIVNAKKGFSRFIDDNNGFAKQIRVNVDAHFDGNYRERLNLIKNLSYCDLFTLYYTYIDKMHVFLSELKPVLVALRRSADNTYYSTFIR